MVVCAVSGLVRTGFAFFDFFPDVGCGLAELADALTEAPGQLRDFFGSEQQQHRQGDDEEAKGLHAQHVRLEQ